jgi:hypothetical protein
MRLSGACRTAGFSVGRSRKFDGSTSADAKRSAQQAPLGFYSDWGKARARVDPVGLTRTAAMARACDTIKGRAVFMAVALWA